MWSCVVDGTGHVDAGKSTLMGHLLFLKGQVSKKTLHKYVCGCVCACFRCIVMQVRGGKPEGR